MVNLSFHPDGFYSFFLLSYSIFFLFNFIFLFLGGGGGGDGKPFNSSYPILPLYSSHCRFPFLCSNLGGGGGGGDGGGGG